MAISSYPDFEAWARETLASGPQAYEDVVAAARLAGAESRLAHLREMPDIQFKLVLGDDGVLRHTVALRGGE